VEPVQTAAVEPVQTAAPNGASPRCRSERTHKLELVRVAEIRDFFLGIDPEMPRTFLSDARMRDLIGYTLLVPSETTLVNLAFTSGLVAHALRLDDGKALLRQHVACYVPPLHSGLTQRWTASSNMCMAGGDRRSLRRPAQRRRPSVRA
jgi:hypothetical protein